MYETIATLIPVVLALTEYLKKTFGLKGWRAQLLSWAVGVAAGGLLTRDLNGLALGFLAALAANGVFSLETVKLVLDYLARTRVKLVLLAVMASAGLTVQAQSFHLETGYQVQPVSGPYFLLRYNYPLAQLNLGQGAYVWLLPELGVLPQSFYSRVQVLLESRAWTVGTDLRWSTHETLLRVFLRTEF